MTDAENWREDSIKTRIETGYSDKALIHIEDIEEKIPLKQGLKPPETKEKILEQLKLKRRFH